MVNAIWQFAQVLFEYFNIAKYKKKLTNYFKMIIKIELIILYNF